MSRAGQRRLHAIIALSALLCACSPLSPQPAVDRFAAWRDDGHREEVEAYAGFLRREGHDTTMPLPALLRTSRRWRVCLHDEFSVPPPDLWKNMPPTLRVIARLRDAGIVDPALARSVYRDAQANRCAGGAAQSRHLDNNAIDFDLPDRPNNVEKLCAWWHGHGRASKVGLGFYSATTIHIDTAGFRTWGNDHHRASSLCIKGA